MRVLTSFARPGYTSSEPLFLPDGEFLPAGTALTLEQIKMLRSAKHRIIHVSGDCGARDWEQVPSLNDFMATMQKRFGQEQLHPGTDMIRCAAEDVLSRFIFDVDSEPVDDGT